MRFVGVAIVPGGFIARRRLRVSRLAQSQTRWHCAGSARSNRRRARDSQSSCRGHQASKTGRRREIARVQRPRGSKIGSSASFLVERENRSVSSRFRFLARATARTARSRIVPESSLASARSSRDRLFPQRLFRRLFRTRFAFTSSAACRPLNVGADGQDHKHRDRV